MKAMLYVGGLLPLILAGGLGSLWWSTLTRPWVFVATGIASLYVLLAIVVAAAIFIGPSFGNYFLEAPRADAVPSTPLPVTEIGALVVFIGLGVTILWGLKQWLQP